MKKNKEKKTLLLPLPVFPSNNNMKSFSNSETEEGSGGEEYEDCEERKFYSSGPVTETEDCQEEDGGCEKEELIINNNQKVNFSIEKTIFVIDFSSGYTFRQFIEFSKRITREVPLIFSRRGLSSVICSQTKVLVSNFVFRGEDLMKYNVDANHVSFPSKVKGAEWFHCVNVDTHELFDQIRNVAKKDGIRIYQKHGQNDIVYVQVYGSKMEGDISIIRTRVYNPVSYKIIEPNSRPTIFPNVTVPLCRFCGCLTGLIKARFVRITFKVYNSGLIVIGKTSTGAATRSASFGNIPNDDFDSLTAISASNNEEYNLFSLSQSTASALIKLSNFHQEGIVRIYCSGPYVLRLEVPVGCYGSVKIYIADSPQVRGGSTQGLNALRKVQTQHSNALINNLTSSVKAIEF